MRARCVVFFTASVALSIRRMRFSISTTSFRLRELLLSKTAWPCDRSRQKFRSGNLWSKPIAHFWRPPLFGESAVNLRIRESSPKQSLQLEEFPWRKFLKQLPKPQRSSSGLIAHENRESKGASARRERNAAQIGCP